MIWLGMYRMREELSRCSSPCMSLVELVLIGSF